MNVILVALVLACFVPISIETSAGFVSPADFVVAAGCGLAFLKVLAGKVGLWRPALKAMAASFATFFIVLVCEFSSGGAIDIGAVVKYGVFLLAIPLLLVIDGKSLSPRPLGKLFHEWIALGGTVLSCIVILQLLRGAYTSSTGEDYYVQILGQPVHKNYIGALLVFGVVSAGWSVFQEKRFIYLFPLTLQASVILLIGNRSSFLVGLAFLAVVFAKSIRSARSAASSLAVAVVVMVFAVAATVSGLLDAQIGRIADLSSTNNSQLTAASARLFLWDYAWQGIERNPVFGYGFGNFLYIAPNWLNGREEPHNAILQIWYAVGIVGLIAFCVLIFWGVRQPARLRAPKSVLPLLLAANILNAMVGIIWIRGEGHLFWLIFFLVAAGIARSPQAPPAIARRKAISY